MHIGVKKPGSLSDVKQIPLSFKYSDIFDAIPEAYQTLLLDVLKGDQTLFVHSDEVLGSWKLYDPLLRRKYKLHPYARRDARSCCIRSSVNFRTRAIRNLLDSMADIWQYPHEGSVIEALANYLIADIQKPSAGKIFTVGLSRVAVRPDACTNTSLSLRSPVCWIGAVYVCSGAMNVACRRTIRRATISWSRESLLDLRPYRRATYFLWTAHWIPKVPQ